MSLEDLPDDCIELIVAFNGVYELLTVSSVTYNLHRIVQSLPSSSPLWTNARIVVSNRTAEYLSYRHSESTAPLWTSVRHLTLTGLTTVAPSIFQRLGIAAIQTLSVALCDEFASDMILSALCEHTALRARLI